MNEKLASKDGKKKNLWNKSPLTNLTSIENIFLEF